MKFVDDDDDDDDMPLCDVGLQNSHNKPNMRIKRLLCKWKFINADENGTVKHNRPYPPFRMFNFNVQNTQD